jgi:hypothetical protein
MKYLATTCAIAVLLTGGPPAHANDSTEPGRKELRRSRVAGLAREYRELRAKRRDLSPGVRLKELDDHGGRLHQTLSALGVELGHPPRTDIVVIEDLGQPDAILRNREMSNYLGIYDRQLRKSAHKIEQGRDRKYLIYFWRGWHDFLFFISEGGVIVDHGWWFAYE